MSYILVIDDDANIRDMLESALSGEGYQVATAIDGQEGVERLNRNRPNLILLDLMMPRLDGYGVLEHLTSTESLKQIPVIILTALTPRDQIVRGLQRGANDYITKPFNLQEVLARVRVQLRIQELEEKIRQSEAYHRALFERASDPELVLDDKGTILRANGAALSLLDTSSDVLLNQPFKSLVGPEDLPGFEVAFAGAFEGSDIPIFEVHLQLSNDRALPVDADLCSVDISGQRHLLVSLRDITRRKAAEARSRTIFEYIGDGIVITDDKGIILMASRSIRELTGFSSDEIVGLDMSRLHSEERAHEWHRLLERPLEGSATYPDRLQHRDGREVPVEWTLASFAVGSETYFSGVARDLTDRQLAEERSRESERLTTLLQIAGGAAHEINQPLTAILGYAEMVMSLLPEDDPVHSYQKHIATAAMRISDTIKQMQAVREYRTRPYASGHHIVDFRQSASPDQTDAEPLPPET